MCLSGSTFVTLFAYGFGYTAARIFVLLKAGETRTHLRLDRALVWQVIGTSLLYTVPVAGSIRLLSDWVFTGEPHHCMSRLKFMVIAWAVTALGTVDSLVQARIKGPVESTSPPGKPTKSSTSGWSSP